jgi:LssY C-terminus
MQPHDSLSRSALRHLSLAALALVVAYFALAYWLAPLLWLHFGHQRGLAALPLITLTSLGLPGDPLNVGLEGSEADILCSMNAAGWSPADPVTFRSSAKIVVSVLLNRAYPDAPVSPLFYQARREDLAFEKPSGGSPDTRHHVRFWKVLDKGEAGRPVWLGAATFDRSVGVSHYTGQITHHIAPDIDAERDLISADLASADKVEAIYEVSGVGPTVMGRNGGGDPYFTDGEILFSRLAEGCESTVASPAERLPNPPAISLKNWLWSQAESAWRALP